MKILLLPLDDRPVTYLFPQLLAKLAGLEAVVPPRQWQGGLTTSSQKESLLDWIKSNIASAQLNYVLLCLDNLLYGGLVASRRSSETFKQVEGTLNSLFSGTKFSHLFAQSSIMRISDNNDDTEEKPYWKDYGTKLFAWSALLHRLILGEKSTNNQLATLEKDIPAHIRDDYLQTRLRNYLINTELLELVARNKIERLIFSQDDSGTYGLNVLEKQKIDNQAHDLKVSSKVVSYAGTDEVLCTLIAYVLASSSQRKPKCRLLFCEAVVAKQLSRYEGQSIETSIANQLAASGVEVVDERDNADFMLIVHGSDSQQGDHIHLPGCPDLRNVPTQRSVANTLAIIEKAELPCAICDVAYANGSDPVLVDQIISAPQILKKIISYGGWNTTGNTAGSVIAQAVCCWFQKNTEAEDNKKLCLFTRLLDDWGYQACVRPKLTGPQTDQALRQLMLPYAQQISKALDYHPSDLTFTQPWGRTFEIEITVK